MSITSNVTSRYKLLSTWVDLSSVGGLQSCWSCLFVNTTQLSLSLSLNKTNTREMRRRHLLFRWLATAFLTALQIATVKIYEAKGNFTSTQKSAFTSIMFALALLLSLNFLVGTTCVTVSHQTLIRLPRLRKVSRSWQRPLDHH